MYFLFISEGCPTCFFAKKILQEKDEAGYVKIVEVQFDNKEHRFMTYLEGKCLGPSPVDKVPAFYNGNTEEVFTGEKAIEEIIHASWKS